MTLADLLPALRSSLFPAGGTISAHAPAPADRICWCGEWLDRFAVPRRPLIVHWGGISLARQTTATILNDNPSRIWSSRSELVQRLLADTCEQCGSTNQAEVHHVRHLKDLQPKGKKQQPEWAKRMAARHRKTLVVCRACHEDIHAGRPQRQPL